MNDAFLATLAHELRNGLAPIRSAVEILRVSGGDERATNIIDRQVRQMTRLVEDLLDVTAPEHGKLSVRPQAVELGTVVRDAAEASQPQFRAAGIELKATTPGCPVRVNADTTRVGQVIQNLLSNALKFTPPAGTVWLTLATGGGHAEISVRDTGVGLAPEDLGRIFERFVQVDREAQFHRGLGIGLALAKTIVEQHGGTIVVSSAGLGQGADFTISFPLTADPARE